VFPIVIALTVRRDVCHGLNLSPMVYLNTVTLISEESEATAMEPHNWSKSEFEYGRKVLHSALEGARCGEEAFLKGRSLSPFLGEGVRDALMPAAVGACIGLLGSYPGDHRSSMSRALAFGLVGWVLGLGAGVAWKTRGLTECVASNAFRNIGKVRDEHWLESHPIDYA
jgi:hypothetical protein